MLQLVAMTAVAWQQWVTTDRLNLGRFVPLISFINNSRVQVCPHIHTHTHTKKNTHTHMYIYSDVISEDFTKTQTNCSVSDVTVVMETSEQGLSFFFFLSTPETSSFLSSLFAHLFHLPLLFPEHVSSLLRHD